ncbi:ankyrin repeat-containing domain protein [Xylariaceae sp. FL0662B]|nr:ankyrin repeat-containing domain protein [Xylariaceae sp. FL0662B]
MSPQIYLPPEIINTIIDFITDQRDLLTCTKVSQVCYDSSCQLLYNRLESQLRNRLLFWAAFHGRFDTARRLLRAGARLDLVLDTRGHRPDVADLDLQWVYTGSRSYPIEPYSSYIHRSVNTRYWTPIYMAATKGQYKLASFFFDYAVKRDSIVLKERLLMAMCRLRDQNVIQRLLDLGANPNTREGLKVEAETPLHVLLQPPRDLESIQLLLRYGADPNLPSKGKSPLAMATIHDEDTASIELLLKAGANPFPEGVAKPCLMSIAIKRNNCEMLKFFITQAVDRKLLQSRLLSLVGNSCIYGRFDCITALREHGEQAQVDSILSSSVRLMLERLCATMKEKHKYWKTTADVDAAIDTIRLLYENRGPNANILGQAAADLEHMISSPYPGVDAWERRHTIHWCLRQRVGLNQVDQHHITLSFRPFRVSDQESVPLSELEAWILQRAPQLGGTGMPNM